MSERSQKLLGEIRQLSREEQLAFCDLLNASFQWERKPDLRELSRMLALRIKEIHAGDTDESVALRELLAAGMPGLNNPDDPA